MSNARLFGLTFVATAVVLSFIIYLNRDNQAQRNPKLNAVSENVFITSQLHPQAVRVLGRRGISDIVDMRPDGEAADQPSSAEMAKAAKATEVGFHYIPVPHETIPDHAVDSLISVLSEATGETVLYCRTGRRAVRLLALAEASRSDGPDLDSILQMAQDVGFTADDLRANMEKRIAARTTPKKERP